MLAMKSLKSSFRYLNKIISDEMVSFASIDVTNTNCYEKIIATIDIDEFKENLLMRKHS